MGAQASAHAEASKRDLDVVLQVVTQWPLCVPGRLLDLGLPWSGLVLAPLRLFKGFPRRALTPGPYAGASSGGATS
jgi:hypothetical protein